MVAIKQRGIVDRAQRGAGQSRRLALLATTALLSLAPSITFAQVVIDGGATETVPGTQASPWTIGNTLTVGAFSNGTLNIGPGGVVSNTDAIVGDQIGSSGTVDVSGAGAIWNSSGALIIGSTGSGSLTVRNDATATANNVTAGVYPGSSGGIVVDGASSVLSVANQLIVGDLGYGALEVRNGGWVVNTEGYIGYMPSGYANQVSVTGANSRWDNLGPLYVGYNGDGSLAISGGGTVNAIAVGIGSNTPAATGAVNVDGPGSSLNVLFNLYVGFQGSGQLTLTNGAQATAYGIFVGDQTDAIGSIRVSGVNSILTSAVDTIIGNLGRGSLTIENGGAVMTGGNAAVGAETGSSGGVLVTGAGSLWDIAGSTLSVGGASGAGYGQLTVNDGATVTVGNGNGLIEAGLSSNGFGRIVIGGAITSPGNNPPAAPGTINAAEVQVGDHGTGSLVFNHTSSNYTFTPIISGNGNVDNVAGTTILTADSNGFAGITTVSGGHLVVNGKLGSTVYVQADPSQERAMLSGTGTIGALYMGTNSIVAPGNLIGTLNVVGNVIFNGGSIYQVELNAAGQSDRIAAGGTATISGGSVQVLAGAGNYALSTQYTVLTATGGRSGTFDSVSSNLAFLAPSLSYDANTVYLTMTRNSIDFAAVGDTRNERAAGAGVESAGWSSPIYTAVLNLSGPQARAAFDQLSGEVHASVQNVIIQDSHFLRDASLDRLRSAFDGVGAVQTPVMSYASGGPVLVPGKTERFAIWGRAFGAWGTTNSDGNAARLRHDVGGAFIGADGLVGDNWRFGLLAGYSRSTFRVSDRSSSGASDTYHLGVYGGSQFGALAFRSGASLSWHDITTNRAVNFPGFTNSLHGRQTARTAQVFGELGYGIRAGSFGFEPFANLAYVNLTTDGFSETGGPAALAVRGNSTGITYSTLGLRASQQITFGSVSVTARGTIGWRHAFGDVTPISAAAFAGGTPFTVAGLPIAKNAALIEAGLDFNLTPQATLGLSYGGQFGSRFTDQSVRGNFIWKF
ncbi:MULTISPECIES: autotransporter domain-containing protein [unclassified Beijerinckia]|uniref:autotransporter outer membrane beta-barrel domain-containing protein n=1 Tax=unclassified Beijerinckia TaxID=2638183 RepID=UPI00089BC0A3|nr:MULTISPECIES: autotransporter domain-containing protein [unclassified Beijerinckia]MDH7795536.1 subtilase-type serine protease [Beijerinckia sp. GAS462]SEC05617.1 outer membrane autotransporter barrel domain-containing protein [Beijerinckia sp. 28-YEA-48]